MEEFRYSYIGCDDSLNRIQSITLRRSTNGGLTWTNVQYALYEYYGQGEDHGSVGDLKTVSRIGNVSNTLSGLGADYYRYYKDGEQNGFRHGLKYIFKTGDLLKLFEAAAEEDWLSMTDMQMAPYASMYFEYDNQRRVVKEKVDGGTQTFSFQYFMGSVSSSSSVWLSKTIETLPDGSQKTIYTNKDGNILLTSEQKSSNSNEPKIVNFYEYDLSGRESQHFTPDAINSYSEPIVPGLLTVNTFSDQGLIKVKEYYKGVAACSLHRNSFAMFSILSALSRA